jgi:hypothetical protein
MQFLQYINEKQIMFHSQNGGKKYGNIVLLAGGAGSGKGFAIKNFMEGNLFKIRDVDEMKKLWMQLADLKKKYPEIRNLDLRQPKDVYKIHMFVKEKGTKSKTFDLLMQNLQKGRLPNLLFDITFKDKGFKWHWLQRMIDIGYDPKDVNLVWVLTAYPVAVTNNRDRARVVPDKILLSTHEGAAINMIKVIKGDFPQINDKSMFDGAIHVILNNKENTLFWAGYDKKTKKAVTTKDIEKAIKTKPTKAEIDLYNKTDGEEGKAPQPVIADFKYLTLKKKGQSMTTNDAIMKEVKKWIIDNIPKSVEASYRLADEPLPSSLKKT